MPVSQIANFDPFVHKSKGFYSLIAVGQGDQSPTVSCAQLINS